MLRRHLPLIALIPLAGAACSRPSPAPTQKDTPPRPEPTSAPDPTPVDLADAPPEADMGAKADLGSASAPAAPEYLEAPLREHTCPDDLTIESPHRSGEPDQLRPKFNADEEIVWFGPEARAAEPVTQGPWERDGDAMLLRAPRSADPGARLWLPGADGAQLEDAMTRFRLLPDEGLDVTLLVRAKTAPDGALAGAWGVELDGATARLVRLDGTRGDPARLGPTETLYKLADRRAVEVLVYTVGPRLHVQIHDADTGVELVSMHARDEAGPEGAGLAGLLAPDDQDSGPEAAATLLSQRPLCGAAEPAPTGHRPPRSFVTLTARQARQLAPSIRDALTEIERVGRGRRARVVFQTDSVGLERLLCEPVEPEDVEVEIPWKYVDEDYLTYRDQPLVRDGEDGWRVDLSFKHPRRVGEMMRAWHDSYPEHTRLLELGRSRQGRPIWAMAIARDLQDADPRPAILLNGAHHGDEPTSTEIVFDALRYLLANPDEDPRVARWLDELVIWVVPQVNPDGAHAFLERSWHMGRKNGHDLDADGHLARTEGVDLNRNYPFRWGALGERGSSSDPESPYFRGPSPASEPETRALMRLVDEERFVASISYHTGTVCLLAPYTIDRVRAPRPNEAWQIGRDLVRAMPPHPEGRDYRLRKNLYPVDGTDQDWMRAEYGTLAYLVEAVRRTPRDHCTRDAVVTTNRPSWTHLLERVLDGPTILGRVVDAQGAPVDAVVSLKEQRLRAGERWRARARDGQFGRLVLEPGTYTLQVEVDGFDPHTHTVEVAPEGATHTTVTLPFRAFAEAE